MKILWHTIRDGQLTCYTEYSGKIWVSSRHIPTYLLGRLWRTKLTNLAFEIRIGHTSPCSGSIVLELLRWSKMAAAASLVSQGKAACYLDVCSLRLLRMLSSTKQQFTNEPQSGQHPYLPSYASSSKSDHNFNTVQVTSISSMIPLLSHFPLC